MKRTVIVATVMTVLTGLFAAGSHASTWEYGFRLGTSVSHFTGADKDSLGADFNPGITASGWLKANLTRNVGVRLEMNYVEKGGRETFIGRRQVQNTVVSANFDVTNNFSYFEVPILLVLTNTNETGSTRLGVYGGPAFALNLSADQEVAAGDLEANIDLSDAVKSNEIGLMVGVESGFRIGENTLLTLDLRWTYALDSFDDSGQDLEIKNSAFQLMMGLGLPVGGIIAPPPPIEEPVRY